jgi:hypothetical protein
MGETTISVDVELLAPYPYFRGTADEEASFISGGGFELPLEFPFEIPSFGVVSEVENVGTVFAPVTIRIDGEVETPRITNLTTGATLTLDTTIAEGEYIIVQTAYGRKSVVRYPGETNDIAAVDLDESEFWSLAPGLNTIEFSANATGTGAAITLTWRPEWSGI